MRLIDADGLMDDIRKHSESYFADDFAHIWVDKQPTVDAEPVRHGQWDYVTVVDDGFWRCSSCGIPSEAIGAKKLYKYCPFCGARLDGEGEKDET